MLIGFSLLGIGAVLMLPETATFITAIVDIATLFIRKTGYITENYSILFAGVL